MAKDTIECLYGKKRYWSLGNPDSRFTGVAGNSSTVFNGNITTDEYGNASGIILVPSGYAPKENTSWTGDVNTVIMDDTSKSVFLYRRKDY